MKVTVFMIIVGIIFLCIFVGLLTLIVRALLKYIHSKDVRQEKSVVRKSLGEALKVHRTQCKMTQEFVAETIGVSRQAGDTMETAGNGRKKTLPVGWRITKTSSRRLSEAFLNSQRNVIFIIPPSVPSTWEHSQSQQAIRL